MTAEELHAEVSRAIKGELAAGTDVKQVEAVLKYRGDLTRREQAAETRLPESTITDALSTLQERGLVDHHPLPTEPRARLYYLDEAPGIG